MTQRNWVLIEATTYLKTGQSHHQSQETMVSTCIVGLLGHQQCFNCSVHTSVEITFLFQGAICKKSPEPFFLLPEPFSTLQEPFSFSEF